MSNPRLECLTSPNLKAITIGDTTTVTYDLNSHCPCGKKYIEHEYWQKWLIQKPHHVDMSPYEDYIK